MREKNIQAATGNRGGFFVSETDTKKALDNPSLGIKVIDVREADEYEIAKVDGVPLLPLRQINEFNLNQ